MATTSSLNSLRISGLSSGLDTESLVKSMLTTMQSKVNRQSQTTTKLEWKADALRDINSKIRAFREANMSVLNSANNMLSASAYNAFSVTMTTSTTAVSVSAGSSANTGTVTINSITQLASAASVNSTQAFKGDSINTSTKLSELQLTNALEFEDDEISFSINGKDFTFNKDNTLADMMSQINASGAGVKMSYSSLTKGFTIASKSTGSASEVTIVNVKGNAFAVAQGEGEEAVAPAFGIEAGTKKGEDAKLKINGIDVVRSSNSFSIDGITYTLNDKSTSEIKFTVAQDVESTLNKIVSFIGSYNDLVKSLQDKVGEKVYRAFDPLTDEQRDALSEDDIKKWEEKAKSGLLRNDSVVSGLLSAMRSAFYTAVEGTGLSPSQIGLTTGGYADGGKITVDKDKLRAALQNNPDAVTNMFTAKSTSTDKKQAFKETGLMGRLSTALLNYTSSVTSDTLSGLEKQISDSKDLGESLLDKMSVKEESLYKRFTAMEAALSSLNSQSNWLSSMLG